MSRYWPLLAIVLIVFLLALAKLTLPKTTSPDSDLTTYTSVVAHYSFQYPASTFIYKQESLDGDIYFSNQLNGEDPTLLGPEGIWLTLNQSTTQPEVSSAAISLAPVGTAKMYEFHPSDQSFTLPIYSFKAVWGPVSGKYYALTWSQFKNTDLENVKLTFDRIVSTFKP